MVHCQSVRVTNGILSVSTQTARPYRCLSVERHFVQNVSMKYDNAVATVNVLFKNLEPLNRLQFFFATLKMASVFIVSSCQFKDNSLPVKTQHIFSI
jgi:hypothetical protein